MKKENLRYGIVNGIYHHVKDNKLIEYLQVVIVDIGESICIDVVIKDTTSDVVTIINETSYKIIEYVSDYISIAHAINSCVVGVEYIYGKPTSNGWDRGKLSAVINTHYDIEAHGLDIENIKYYPSVSEFVNFYNNQPVYSSSKWWSLFIDFILDQFSNIDGNFIVAYNTYLSKTIKQVSKENKIKKI